MTVAVCIFLIIFTICAVVALCSWMDNRNSIKKLKMNNDHELEKKKLELLSRNPELFKKVFEGV